MLHGEVAADAPLGLDIANDHGSKAHERSFADLEVLRDYRARADPDVVTHYDVAVNHGTVPDENAFPKLHAMGHKCIRSDAALLADPGWLSKNSGCDHSARQNSRAIADQQSSRVLHFNHRRCALDSLKSNTTKNGSGSNDNILSNKTPLGNHGMRPNGGSGANTNAAIRNGRGSMNCRVGVNHIWDRLPIEIATRELVVNLRESDSWLIANSEANFGRYLRRQFRRSEDCADTSPCAKCREEPGILNKHEQPLEALSQKS